MVNNEVFLDELYPDGVKPYQLTINYKHQVSANKPFTLKTEWFGDTKKAYKRAIALAESTDVWFGICLRESKLMTGRGNNKATIYMPGMWVDIDCLHGCHTQKNLPGNLEDIKILTEGLPLPSGTIKSGHGYHLHWIFKEGWVFETDEERDEAQNLIAGFQQTIRNRAEAKGWFLDNTSDLARILRLPGTKNHKDKNNIKLVEIIDLNSNRYNPGDFDDYVPSDHKTTGTQTPRHKNKQEANWDLIRQKCAWANHCVIDAAILPEPEWYGVSSLVGRCQDGYNIIHQISKPYPGYSIAETDKKYKHSIEDAGPRTCENIRYQLNGSFCGLCKQWGRITSPIQLGEDDIPSLVRKILNSDDPGDMFIDLMQSKDDLLKLGRLHRKYGERYQALMLRLQSKPKIKAREISALGKAIKSAQKRAAYKKIPNGRPRISADEGNLEIASKFAIDALLAGNNPPELFMNGGMLSRIRDGDDEKKHIDHLDHIDVRHYLARKAYYYTNGKGPPVSVFPPIPVAQDILSNANLPFPRIDGITELPVFSAEGDLQLKPGYSDKTNLYYDPKKDLWIKPVKDVPSKDDVKKAKELLDEVYWDFPFVNESDRTHTIALQLQPMARMMIDGVTPLYLVEKPGPGTGASLLVTIATLIGTGTEASVMSEAKDDDEWRKRITSTLRQGAKTVWIDNLREKLDSGALSAAITSPWWSDRLLGSSKQIILAVKNQWIATGNNPQLSNEMSRRTLSIKMDAKLDKPWSRKADEFLHPKLMDWVKENYAELVWAQMTLIKSWVANGKVEFTERKIGMFEEWSAVMGGILKNAGYDDFLENMEEFYEEADYEGAMTREFIKAWWNKSKTAGLKIQDLYDIVNRTLVDLDLGSGNPQSRNIKLGLRLRQMRDRQFKFKDLAGTERIVCVRIGKIKDGFKLWYLEPVNPTERKLRPNKKQNKPNSNNDDPLSIL